MSFDYRKPGVYVEESLLVNSADAASASSIAMFVGAANLGPTEQPVRCDTWSDYVRNFGSFEDVSVTLNGTTTLYKSYLPYAVYSYFQNGGNPCYVQRAVDTTPGKTGTNSYLFVPISGQTVNSSTITNRTVATTFSVTKKVATTSKVTLTVAGHPFKIGQVVTIDGISETTLNGTFTITETTTNTFSYALSGSVISEADITGASAILADGSSFVTLTVNALNGIAIDDTVSVEGFTGDDSVLNGSYTVLHTASTTLIRYVASAIPVSMQEVAAGTPSGSPRITDTANVAFEVQALSIGAANNTVVVSNTITKGLSLALEVVDTTNNVFDIIVYKDNIETERFQTLTMNGAINGTKRADLAVNDPYSGSNYIRLANYNSLIEAPENIINAASGSGVLGKFVGGTDSSVPSTSADYVTHAQLAVNKVQGPLLLNLVGYTTDANAAKQFFAPTGVSSSSFPDRGDVFIINDAVRPRIYGESSAAYKGVASSALSSYSGDSYVASFSPWIIIPDPVKSGATVTVPPGGAVAGVMSRVDNTIGVFRAPAGVIAGISNAVGVDAKWNDSELGDLNSSNINIIRPVAGAGIAIMGARTRKAYGADRYVSGRRTLIYIKESLRRSTQFALFENNDQRLWGQLQMTAERLLRPLWEAGGLRGASAAEAYYIKCDSTINTPSVIQSGEVRMEIGVALEYPAEFIVIRVSQVESGAFTAEVQPRG
jgi:phage tail sheath protein FI